MVPPVRGRAEGLGSARWTSRSPRNSVRSATSCARSPRRSSPRRRPRSTSARSSRSRRSAGWGSSACSGSRSPRSVGGQGGDLFMLCLALEEIGRYDSSVAITLEAGVGLAANPLFRFGTAGTEGAVARAARRAARRSARSRSPNPAAARTRGRLRTTARLEGGEWMIDGSKAFITNSGTPITVARDRRRARRRGGRHVDDRRARRDARPHGRSGYRKVGWRASDTHELAFDGVPRPRGPPARRARSRLRAVPRDARRRPRRDRRDVGRRRARVPRGERPVRDRARGLRPADRLVRGAPVQDRRHEGGGRARAARGVERGVAPRSRASRSRPRRRSPSCSRARSR